MLNQSVENRIDASAARLVLRSFGKDCVGFVQMRRLLLFVLITLFGCHEVFAQGACLTETRRFTRKVDGQVLYYVEVQNKCSRAVNVRTCSKGLGCKVSDFKANDRYFIWIGTEPITSWSETTEPAPQTKGKAF